MGRPLKFKMADTTLTSDVNQTLSNLLSQTNKVKTKVETVSVVANTALVRSTNPSLTLEQLSDVLIAAIQNGQTITWNGTDWVNTSIGVASGTPIFDLPGGGVGFTAGAGSYLLANDTAFMFFTGRAIKCLPNKFKIAITNNGSATTISKINIAVLTQDTSTVVSSTSITFGGSTSPTLAAGVNVSDAISLTFDANHDYVIRLYTTNSLLVDFLQTSTGVLNMAGGSCLGVSGDQTTASTVSFSGGTIYTGQSWITVFQSA